jgi:hypothetical protein
MALLDEALVAMVGDEVDDVWSKLLSPPLVPRARPRWVVQVRRRSRPSHCRAPASPRPADNARSLRIRRGRFDGPV